MKLWHAFGIGLAASMPATAQMTMPMDMATKSKMEKPTIPTMIADQSKAKSLPLPAGVVMMRITRSG